MSQRMRTQLWRTQNALADPRLAAKLASISQVGPRDVVYDLGAGSGALTAALARRGSRVIAIEQDPALVNRLRRRFRDVPNVVVREGDILACPFPRSDHVIVANPPFDITADLVRKLTEAQMPPRDAYLVLQREAAWRFAARSPATLAAVLIAPWFSVRVLHNFQRRDFAPAPGVDAVFVRLHKRGPPLVSRSDERLYRDFVTVAFSAWRPTIAAALAATFGRAGAARLLAHATVDGHLSPSQLGATGWLRLFREFRSAPFVVRQRVAGGEAHARQLRARLRKIHRTRTPRDALDGPPLFDMEPTRSDRMAPVPCGHDHPSITTTLRSRPPFDHDHPSITTTLWPSLKSSFAVPSQRAQIARNDASDTLSRSMLGLDGALSHSPRDSAPAVSPFRHVPRDRVGVPEPLRRESDHA